MHPKAMYQMTKAGMVEKIAMSFDEEWKLAKSGWYPHPEEARQGYQEVEEEQETSLEDLSKSELEKLAREEFGVELDRRKSKDNLIAQIRELMQ